MALRTVATLTAADGVFQALLAGRFLAGNFDALGLHGANTSVLAALTITLLGVVIMWCRNKRGPWRPTAVMLALVAAEGAQVWFAQRNLLELHVPLGVGIIATLGLLTAWAWQTTVESDKLLNLNTASSAQGTAPSAHSTTSPTQVTTSPAECPTPPTQVATAPAQVATPTTRGGALSARGMVLPARGVVR
ncbi:hypothetical protein ACFXHA_32245 [Nocardia sp. NPDC059240]|uniref:hypothetical protein n=1 Tax=Nocardia sp. NPDC059240 TaxID=3346786 RepID=UPI00367EA018